MLCPVYTLGCSAQSASVKLGGRPIVFELVQDRRSFKRKNDVFLQRYL